MTEKLGQFINRYWWVALLIGALVVICALVILLYTVFIPLLQPDVNSGSTNPVLSDTSNTVDEGDNLNENGESELEVGLDEGGPQPIPVTPVPKVSGEPLTQEEIEAIYARLPALISDPGEMMDFKLPEESLPPPRTGETIDEAFPPPEAPVTSPPVETGPLEVLRFAPEGEIPLAPFINVTFNQPMVPVGTLVELAVEEVPLLIEPSLPGTWRWIGTKTITFNHDSTLIDRLPMATEYKVTVPAGTESATGGRLEEDVQWSFNTPPPKMISSYPYDIPQPLNPLFFVAFDQRINPQAVLETIQVMAGEQSVRLKLVSDDVVKEDKEVSRLAESSEPGRWLAFQAIEPLPADTSISVVVGPDTPSAEGPLVTQSAQHYSFHTYAPLRIEEHGCSWSNDQCRPLSPFYIRFNNPIDVETYQDSMLSIEPELPGASVDIFGNTITIRGATEGQKTYRVRVSGSIKDVFGQTLGKDTSLTFRVGPADPLLLGPEQILVTLDPAASKPVFSVYAINYNKLDVQIYAVEPSDWPAFKEYLREYQRTDLPPEPPGRLVLDESMPLETPSDTLTEVGIELGEVMDGNYGQFIVIVKPPRSLFQTGQDRYWETIHAWVQVTQIGLDAFVDHSQMVVWTNALKDGAPLEGVTVTGQPAGVMVVSGLDGTARIELLDSSISYLVANKGEDQAILPNSPYYWGDDSWNSRPPNDELRWYVIDDRGMYRPGEDVHVKGWLRRIGGKQDGDVGLVGGSVTDVNFQVIGPQGNELESGQSKVNALGGFDFIFTLPENANLGYAQLQLDARGELGGLDGTRYHHNFQIQEFRRPEFEVQARNETTGPYFVGEEAVVVVEAKYYAGGPLPNAEVSWTVTSSPSNYQPPNWPDFTFGEWIPWWWYYEPVMEVESFGPFGSGFEGGTVENYSGVTDASGEHYLRLDFEKASEQRPYSVLAEATVFDVNRQAWAGTTSLLVHPAEFYVGLRSERTFVERGEPLEIEMIVTDLDGEPVLDRPIQVKAARLEWKYRSGDWREEEVDIQECTVGSKDEPVSCVFETDLGGRYQITATVTDELGRQNQSRFTRWVSGGQRPPSRKVEQESVTLIPDKKTYQPGDTAQILVQAPFSPAEGLLTVSRSGMLYTERFVVDEESLTLQVPVEDKHIPNLHIQVDLVGAAPRIDDQGEVLTDIPPRPAYASGQLNLNIPPLQRTLSLEVSPREKELEPGGETTIDLLLLDKAEEPVSGAELAVIVVDEAILALSNYQLTNPMDVFYNQRAAYLNSHYSRASLVLVDPQVLLQDGRGGGSDIAGDALATQVFKEGVVEEAEMAAPAEAPAAEPAGPEAQPIRVRMDFNPLATFAPAVRTGLDGKASVEVKLPDNLTSYRVMVVAVDDGKQFGSAETNLVARLPLMVRPSAPRFLNFGDSFELPVVLQNQTSEPMTVDVVLQAANIELTESAGKRVTVPGQDRIEVRFPATTLGAGTARFQVAAVSGDYADAATIALPVYTPATTEAFATYGVVDEGAINQPVTSPDGVFPQFGGLEITTSSTALQALTDAVIYLVSYPFECTEQLASRILGVAALRDVLTAFSAEGLPSPGEMESAVQRDIERLAGLQNYDGGFPYWRRGWDSIPFNSIHVAHALQAAKLKGFEVPPEIQASVLEYLRYIEDHYPHWYSLRTRQTLSAYALYVRDLMGDRDVDKARRLLAEAGLEDLSLEAVGWLWMVLADDPSSVDELEAIRRHINNRAIETAGAANFTTSYGDEAYLLLHSDRRTDAILLDALIQDNPENDLIPKVVNGLLAHRTKGRWYNTQENVFVLLALDRYFNTFEAQTPDFVARIWLGDTYAGEHQYEGRTTERRETTIPMAYLMDGTGTTQDLILSKEGTGRLYYRLGLRYAPTDLDLEPVDMGFVVTRVYEAVDDPEDVYQDEDGVWHIKAGARVRVKVTMVADNRRYHVALVDPLPAGLEILNPALAVSGSTPQDPNSSDYRYGWWWWGTWYEHQNMRDERAEAFTSLLWDGVYNYTYVTRATTPGKYTVPPPKAEEMYSPEVFGRGSSDWVIVE